MKEAGTLAQTFMKRMEAEAKKPRIEFSVPPEHPDELTATCMCTSATVHVAFDNGLPAVEILEICHAGVEDRCGSFKPEFERG